MVLEYLSAKLGISTFFLILILIWTLAWEGLALWKSARLNHLAWFVAMLLINSFGILEILYFFFFSEIVEQPSTKRKLKAKKRKRQKAFLDK